MDIKKLDRAALKSYFVKNAVPTESNFADLIDGMLNQKEDGLVRLPGEPLSIQADGNDSSQKKAINFYRSFTDAKPAWTLSLNPRVDPSNAATARLGWSVGDADGGSKLFIDQTTGNLGVGTVDPGPYRLNVVGPALFTGNYLFVNSENAGRLRVGAVAGMPGLFSGDDGPKPLMLGVPAGQKVYLGGTDASVEGGTGNAFFKGKVGIGTAVGGERLELNGRVKAGTLSVGPWPANDGGYVFFGANNLDQSAAGNYALLQGVTDGPGRTFLNSPVDIRFRINNADRMVLLNNGDVQFTNRIGVFGQPAAPRLGSWAGGIHTWDLEAEGTVWSRGGYQSGARDLAENYVSDASLESADVVSLDPTTDCIVRSDKPNDALLVGIVSSNPGFLLNVDHESEDAKRFPIALCGRVPCKVVDENGAIKRGDLLTSSSTPGHAMRAEPIEIGGEKVYRPGTIIGKAFGPLDSGAGVIEVVVFSS